MAQADTLRAFYQSAREELIERIRLRDTALALHLAASAAVLGLGLGTVVREELLLVLPQLSLGSALVITQHQSAISRLSLYCTRELEPQLAALGEGGISWDGSMALRHKRSQAVFLRSVAQMLLIGLPGLVGLVWNREAAVGGAASALTWWAGGLTLSLATILMTLAPRSRRKVATRIYADSEPTAPAGPAPPPTPTSDTIQGP